MDSTEKRVYGCGFLLILLWASGVGAIIFVLMHFLKKIW